MKAARHWIGLLLIWAPLALCATPKPLAALRHVGVVSLFGDTLHGFGVGLMSSDNFRYTTEVPAWNIDRGCEGFLQAKLKENGYPSTLLDIRPRRADDLYGGADNDEPNFDELRRIAAARRPCT